MLEISAIGAARRMGVAVCVCIGLVACNGATDAEKLKENTHAALAAKNFSTAVETANQWIKKSPNQYEAYFMLAQAQAQVGDKNGALNALEQALKKGLKDDVQIDSSSNLESIKGMAAYKDLMKNYFPSRVEREENKLDSGTVSITEKNGQQILRAGDIILQVPSVK